MNHEEISRPKPKRLFRWRIVLAILLSLLLHLILIPDLRFDIVQSKPAVLQARLSSNTSESSDDVTRRGDINVTGQTMQAATSTQTTISPNPPKSIPKSRQALQQPTKTTQPKPPSVIKQAKSATSPSSPPSVTPHKPQQKLTSTLDTPKHNSAPVPSTETLEESNQRAKYQGTQEVFSNPLEQAYYETLVSHLNKRLPNHPSGIAGKVRLQVKIQYNAIITSVTIIDSSGHQATDEWAKRAILSVSPVPKVPSELKQPYYFRPTLLLTN